MNFEFLRGELLLMVALLPIWWFATRPNWRSGVLFPRSAPAPMLRSRRGKTIVLAAVPRLLRGAAQASLIFVLAGPILVYQIDAVEREELAMVLAVDLSSSMLAQDMEEGKTRMEVARETAVRFIRGRATDRVGLVAFAGEALTRVPPTDDSEVIVAGIESLDTGLLQDGTDIAGAIVTSTRRLLTEPHESKLIILLTDGAHNAQGITPRQAAEAATANGVKIYAISILGAPIAPDSGAAASEVARAQRARLEQEIETVLTQVARISEGRYFHAANQVALDSIYGEIDELATTSVALLEQTETVPVHGWFLFLAVLLICAEASVKGSRYGVVP